MHLIYTYFYKPYEIRLYAISVLIFVQQKGRAKIISNKWEEIKLKSFSVLNHTWALSLNIKNIKNTNPWF